MKTALDVIVCGSLHLDIVVHAKSLPRVDETAVGSAWKQVCGGKGGNQAVQAARAGAHTAMIGRVGDDAFGQTLRANLKTESVDDSGVLTDSVQGSGMSVAILQDNGDYGAVIVSGSNLAIDVLTLEQQWTALGGAKVLVLQNEVPPAVNEVAARVARASGAIVVCNAAPAREMSRYILDLLDVLIVNRVEAEAMFGMPVSDRTSARLALSHRREHDLSIVITLGGEGLVLAVAHGEIIEIEPIPVNVTSTHGAGDCFVGVLAAQLAHGEPLQAACVRANHMAAAFVSRPT